MHGSGSSFRCGAFGRQSEACESGLGAVKSGEGTIGLRRALLAAGAKQVLSALWPVPDEATLELMKRFYRALWSGKLSAADALTAAQRETIAADRKRGGRLGPRGWAGFVVTVRAW